MRNFLSAIVVSFAPRLLLLQDCWQWKEATRMDTNRYLIRQIRRVKTGAQDQPGIVASVQIESSGKEKWLYAADTGDRLWFFLRDEDIFDVLTKEPYEAGRFRQLAETSEDRIEGVNLRVETYEGIFDELYWLSDADKEYPYWSNPNSQGCIELIRLVIALL